MKTPPCVMVIAGSDSSGGAGIQADIRTITMLGGYAMTAITAITAQNTTGVQKSVALPADLVVAQFTSAAGDIGVDAVKLGMLGSPQVADAVAGLLADLPPATPVVFDPVMAASTGDALNEDGTVAAMRAIADRATLITPNLPELAALTGMTVEGEEAILAAARQLAERHDLAVLAKGGHAAGRTMTDRLVMPDGAVRTYTHPRIETRHTHGTGCTTASAIATGLGADLPLEEAVRRALDFVHAALLAAPGLGAGQGPLGHQAVREDSAPGS